MDLFSFSNYEKAENKKKNARWGYLDVNAPSKSLYCCQKHCVVLCIHMELSVLTIYG